MWCIILRLRFGDTLLILSMPKVIEVAVRRQASVANKAAASSKTGISVMARNDYISKV